MPDRHRCVTFFNSQPAWCSTGQHQYKYWLPPLQITLSGPNHSFLASILFTHQDKLTKTSMILPHYFQCIGLNPGRQVCPSMQAEGTLQGPPDIQVNWEQGKGGAFVAFRPGTGGAISHRSFSQSGLAHRPSSSCEAKSCLTKREALQRKPTLNHGTTHTYARFTK